tara:strand:- start:8592 stop:10706 length:2115 start_codon:yes stop_codon:yes gene_type:complete
MKLDTLNIKQKEAVTKIGGPILVFAGAGSGKTRVLTHKIAYLIDDIGVPPENILAVTFTNKAAQEMKTRIVELVNHDISGISIGTFHSISAQLLRKNISKIGYNSDFTIYDQQDSKTVVKQVIKDFNLDIKQFDPKTYQIKISNAKNSMKSPDYFKELLENYSDKMFYQIYLKYQEILKKNNSVDFDDLLILPLTIFENHPECLKFYQDKYKYVLVDEYQDTNKPQFEFIYSISSVHKDIFVVGDDDQSIYGWRGADISNILNFKDAFGKATIIKLEQNYRSTKTILDAAWHVVSRNLNRADKKLWTDNSEGELIDVVESFDERFESKQVFGKILKYKNELDNVAVLYRTNSQSRIIEDELRKGGIAYQIIGGVKFYDRKEIKDVLAFIKLIVNHNDSVSLERIINFPPRGIGKTTIDKIRSIANNNSSSIFEEIKNTESLKLSIKQKKNLNDFYNLIKNSANRLSKDKGSVIVRNLIKEINLENFYHKQETVDANERWKNIEELVLGIEEYESSKDDFSLVAFLEEVSLLTDIDRWNKDGEALTMMTIHSSKGLEFDYVFIVGLEEGLFPILRDFDDNDLEEERRLFYVALTRSRKKVVLSYAKSRRSFGRNLTISKRSRFLSEIPNRLIDNKIDCKSTISSNDYKSKRIDAIAKGNIVEHKVFGKGVVINVDGVGDSAKLTIRFTNNVLKKLISKYANLRKI